MKEMTNRSEAVRVSRLTVFAPMGPHPLASREGDWIPAHKEPVGASEISWLASNPPELEPFRGMWVALAGRRVLTSSRAPEQVYRELKDLGVDALVTRVATLEESSSLRV
jgi:hypothetical protein